MSKRKDFNNEVGKASANALNDAFDAGRAYQRLIDAQSDFEAERELGVESHGRLMELILKPKTTELN